MQFHQYELILLSPRHDKHCFPYDTSETYWWRLTQSHLKRFVSHNEHWLAGGDTALRVSVDGWWRQGGRSRRGRVVILNAAHHWHSFIAVQQLNVHTYDATSSQRHRQIQSTTGHHFVHKPPMKSALHRQSQRKILLSQINHSSEHYSMNWTKKHSENEGEVRWKLYSWNTVTASDNINSI